MNAKAQKAKFGEASAREGYKLTKLGWIPKEWDVIKIGKVGKVQGGYAFKSSKFTSSGKYQVVKMANLYNGVLDLFRSQSFLCKISNSEKSFIINENDILLTLTGTVGKRDYGHTVFISDTNDLLLNQRVGRIIILDANPKYIYYLTKTERFLNQFYYSARGGTGNQTNVSTLDVESLIIPLPPLPEQQKIAQILSTWDKAIEKTEQLIRAKTQLKKGLMQQLLTGKKRFSEFTDSWKEYHLDELVTKTKGSIVATSSERKGIPLIDTSAFNGEPEYYTEDTNAKKCKINDVLILWDGSKAGRVMTNKVGVVGSTFSIFTPNNKIHNEFLTIRMIYDQKRIMAVREGSGIPHVPKDFLDWYRVTVPNYSEQEKIANAFKNIDIEIYKLNQTLKLIKKRKIGLMQKLLTGEVRVNTNNN